MPAHKIPLHIRIMNHSKLDPNTSCWIWTGAKNKRSGNRGKIKINKKWTSASRGSWLAFKGEIPKDMYVLHTCDNPECVNPNHLYIGNNSDNQKDRYNRSMKFFRDSSNGRFISGA